MTQDITRWLTEIRTLQQQLAATCQERDQAYKSASNWRQLYESEARQRREEAEKLHSMLTTLRTELAKLRGQAREPVQSAAGAGELLADAEVGVDTLEGLRTQLEKALQQCDRLQKALVAEQADHAETRKTLTTALGETIDALSPNSAALVHKSTGSELKPSN